MLSCKSVGIHSGKTQNVLSQATCGRHEWLLELPPFGLILSPPSESSSTCVVADKRVGTRVRVSSRRLRQLPRAPCDAGVLFRLFNRQGAVAAKMNVVPSLVDATSPLYLRRTRLVQFVEVLSAWYLRKGRSA